MEQLIPLADAGRAVKAAVDVHATRASAMLETERRMDYPAAAVTVTVMVCWVVTAVDVGALKRNQTERVPAARTERPV
jgi:hypothetical protein